MEIGFFHPSRGYWQAIAPPTDAQRAAYPEGTVEIPLKPAADHEWTGGAWVPVEPEPDLDPPPP